MDKFTEKFVERFMSELIARNPGESEFHQAVREVVESVAPYVMSYPYLMDQKILERMVEPERVVMFRVPWMDDKGEIQINRGYRVQMNSAIGPYKGGIRFHSSVNLSIIKFLAFEQTFKNALTTLPMGGGKGGSDFNPRGKSDAEVSVSVVERSDISSDNIRDCVMSLPELSQVRVLAGVEASCAHKLQVMACAILLLRCLLLPANPLKARESLSVDQEMLLSMQPRKRCV